MSYYAPFMRPTNYYYPTMQNGLEGQNFANQGYPNAIPNTQQNIQQQPMPNAVPNAMPNAMPNVAQSQQSSDMLWVLNQNEADGYLVAPNCSVVLWDKSRPTIYVKSMSANGMPSMRVLDFTERTETAQISPITADKDLDSKFATKDEIIALKGDFDDLKAMYDRFTKEHSEKAEEKPKTTPKKVKESE